MKKEKRTAAIAVRFWILKNLRASAYTPFEKKLQVLTFLGFCGIMDIEKQDIRSCRMPYLFIFRSKELKKLDLV